MVLSFFPFSHVHVFGEYAYLKSDAENSVGDATLRRRGTTGHESSSSGDGTNSNGDDW